MTTEEIHECLTLNVHHDVFPFSQLQVLLTIHLLIQDYISRGQVDAQLHSAIPASRVVTNLAHWDPRALSYAASPEAQIFLDTSEPFLQETIVKSVLAEERESREQQEATERARLTRTKQEEKIREEEDRCRKLFEMMGICMDERSRHTVDMLKTKELQASIVLIYSRRPML